MNPFRSNTFAGNLFRSNVFASDIFVPARPADTQTFFVSVCQSAAYSAASPATINYVVTRMRSISFDVACMRARVWDKNITRSRSYNTKISNLYTFILTRR